MKIEIEEIIENLIKTLEQNNYSIYELKDALCDCDDFVEDENENVEDKETNQIKRYYLTLEKIVNNEETDLKEKKQLIKQLQQELKDIYQGTNPSKQIKKLYTYVGNTLKDIGKKKIKPFDNNM